MHYAFQKLFNWFAYIVDMRTAFNTRHRASNPKRSVQRWIQPPVKLTISIRGKSTQQQSSAALCEMKRPAVSQSTETTPENTWERASLKQLTQQSSCWSHLNTQNQPDINNKNILTVIVHLFYGENSASDHVRDVVWGITHVRSTNAAG